MAKKFRYTVNIAWSHEDNCFVARVPELKGCVTDGETYEMAAKNVAEAIECYIEALEAQGAPIPVPISEQKFSGKLNVRLGPDLHRDIAARAEAEGKSINDIILDAAQTSLKVGRLSKSFQSSRVSRASKTKKRAG